MARIAYTFVNFILWGAISALLIPMRCNPGLIYMDRMGDAERLSHFWFWQNCKHGGHWLEVGVALLIVVAINWAIFAYYQKHSVE